LFTGTHDSPSDALPNISHQKSTPNTRLVINHCPGLGLFGFEKSENFFQVTPLAAEGTIK